MPENEIAELMKQEEMVKERIDKNGQRRIKKYIGGGVHFLNWLEQYREIYGEEKVEIEEIDPKGFSCFIKGNEKMFRIWVKETK